MPERMRLGYPRQECVMHGFREQGVCVVCAGFQRAMLQHGCLHLEGLRLVRMLVCVRPGFADQEHHLQNRLLRAGANQLTHMRGFLGLPLERLGVGALQLRVRLRSAGARCLVH
mmetsp:Transcript_73323/g.206489  ORF Transcript_73323/g.206489 Transcript_73323/m.206489 type:complete len:114 (+) Transcript_73323:51-392(+)